MKKTEPDLNLHETHLLVVGGSGRVAGMLRRVWSAEPSGMVPVFQARREGVGADLIFDPLADPGALAQAIEAADVVLNLAGRAGGSGADLAAHAAIARAILAARNGAKPVIAASSAAVYDRSGEAQSEAGPVDPPVAYGRAKLEMEAVLRDQPAACCLRIGNVAGADALLGQPVSEAGRSLHVFADGRAPRRSYIGPSDLARAIARLAGLMAAGQPVPPVLNLALPGVVGMDDLLRAAGVAWSLVPAPPEAIENVELDVSRAIRFGLVPEARARAERIVADWRQVAGGSA
ncbi:NAD-dependent epimerase/dehydratase family protein [Pseudothioclava arenosa]|uniref:NAD-dependent epimerase n=1 Tax=Pseudothioclava arenosa TaxID=1795308 RepID=A0A2A4CT82_9RHOB|nr:NAD-dependent epimerase/dehydratase family protein [Pseudothioclava arenosa]PCD77795.1 NAD-dependent epimerase [Pseudothioclava arenosa]